MEQFKVVAIPLGEREIVTYLTPPHTDSRGTPVRIIGQRPNMNNVDTWVQRLRLVDQPHLEDFLTIDNPRESLESARTDRLVPVHFIHEDDTFLTRNLGGWAAIYFAVMGIEAAIDYSSDPMLKHAVVLADYGADIRFVGADPAQIGERLEEEAGCDITALCRSVVRLYGIRHDIRELGPLAFVTQVYNELANDNRFATEQHPPVPRVLLYDVLLDELVRLEQRRRRAHASGEEEVEAALRSWFAAQAASERLHFILKGEYIMGRHRRSTIVIAPQLDVVIKQPAPEPLHEAQMGAREDEKGRPQNWPRLTEDGSLVTPRGRLRLIVEENLLPRLNRAFEHEVDFSTLMGLTIEAYIGGPTMQDYVLENPDALTPALYERVVLHQQVCEALGIENGDWHSANFMSENPDEGPQTFKHIDWGAARALREDEMTEEGYRARLEQISNFGYSFHREELAERVESMHRDLLDDPDRLERIRKEAEAIAEGV